MTADKNDDQWRDGIAETFKIHIADAETQEQKDELIKEIREVAADGNLRREQADELLSLLGVEIKSDPKSEKKEFQNLRDWRDELKALQQTKRTLKMRLKNLNDEKKEAQGILKETEERIDAIIDAGSDKFKEGRLF